LIAPRVHAAETARAEQHANSEITANLLAWLTDEVNVDEYSFAQYCAMCAVLDERVVDLQLKRCSNVGVKALLRSLFGHGDDITKFLVHDSAQATAAQTALRGLLKVEWHDGDPLDVARKMCDAVCCMQRPNEIDDHLWHNIRGFFHCLVSVRWLGREELSELHFSIGAGLCLLAPFVFRADTYMNQALFNTKRNLPELLEHYNVAEAAVCDFAADDDENSIVPFDKKKQRLPDMWARMKTSTKATEVSRARMKKSTKATEVSITAESTAAVLVVSEVKPPRAAPAVVAEDARRLVFYSRTCADLRAAKKKLGDSKGAQQGDASSITSLGTSHAMSDAQSESQSEAAPAAPSATKSTRVSNGASRAQSDGAEKCTAALAVAGTEQSRGGAGTEQSRGGAGAGEAAPGPHRRIGAFGLQVVGTRAILTLMMQVHQSLYANLRLRDLDVRTCSLPEAIGHLVLMIAISECDKVIDGDIAGKLLARAEWEKLDASIKGQLRVAPPTPSVAPGAPQANDKQSGAAGAQQSGAAGSKKVIAGNVARGTIVSDHDERIVVRGGGGDVAVAFKVLLTGANAQRAREDAVHELRVHELLTRRAAAHVVPLVAHCEAPVVLPGQCWARNSIVLVMPWCEPVKVGELVDAREEAQCVEELLAALAALHRLGVLHYDVKWSNTLWLVLGGTGERRRRLVLSDFGLAKQLDVDGRATLQRGVGTDGYMAPEVRDGSALSVTAAVDVYSAGVALRKLPAHAQCEELQELARWMCAEQPYARPTASGARRRVRCVVAPAMQQLTIATQPVNATPARDTSLESADSAVVRVAPKLPSVGAAAQLAQLAAPEPPASPFVGATAQSTARVAQLALEPPASPLAGASQSVDEAARVAQLAPELAQLAPELPASPFAGAAQSVDAAAHVAQLAPRERAGLPAGHRDDRASLDQLLGLQLLMSQQTKEKMKKTSAQSRAPASATASTSEFDGAGALSEAGAKVLRKPKGVFGKDLTNCAPKK
jgi:serine/threonine protein kinase